jgi:glycerophosphoryl diester phosphodiesterase
VFAERPAVLAHRGLGRGTVDGLRENTVASFLAAVERGARWVEVDARRTADDRLVVLHDPVGPGGGFAVDLTAAELSGQGVTLLEEVLTALPAGVGVDLDLKTCLEDAVRPAEETTAALVARVAAGLAGQRPLLVSSFDPGALATVRGLAPELPLGLLTWKRYPLRKAIPAAVHLGAQVAVPHWAVFGSDSEGTAAGHRSVGYAVDVAHRAGLELLAWSGDHATAQRLLDAGVDAVCVDDAPGLLATLAGAG